MAGSPADGGLPYSPAPLVPYFHILNMKRSVITMSTFGTNGRFGNQIFQYAFLKIYAKEHDLQVEIPRWELGEYLFGQHEQEIAQVFPEIRDESPEINESQILAANPPLKNIDISGYFQYHTSYYARYKEYFCHLFQPTPEIQNKLEAGVNLLQSKGRTIVGLHIRLKDYGFSYFFQTPFEWYRDWLNQIWSTLENPVLYIATDEPEKAIAHFSEYHPVTAQDLNVELPGADFYPDFYLLSQCDRVAISNSTFSFAACMLNQRGQQFVRPHFQSQKLIPFEPWNSDPVLRDVKVGQFEPGDLHTLRQQICDRWLSLSGIERVKMTYLGGVGTDHQKIINLGIQDERLTPQDKQFIEKIAAKFAKGINESNIQDFLAVMLYRRSYQLPVVANVEKWTSIPDWFFADFIEFLFDSPTYFTEIGDIQKYSQYIQQLIQYVHGQIFDKSAGDRKKYWEQVAVTITNVACRIPLCFNEENVRGLAVQQTDIQEYAVTRNRHQVDYRFAKRPLTQSKISLGILQSNFGHTSETLSNLPIFEDIDRDKFEVFLYALEINGHPLETYCQSRVKRLVHLPEAVQPAVNTIRSDNLDILLIGSNATGRSKIIELLSLHRLARVQVTNSVSVITTGMQHIDYYIAGKLTAPLPTAQQHYTEELVNLPGSGFCFKYPLTLPEPVLQPKRSGWGATEETVVFISGANFYKIIPELRETWAKIIQAVPNSMLVLYPFGLTWNKKYPMRSFSKQMQRVFSQYDLAAERIFLCDRLPSQADVNACLQLADIYLDAYPYTGALSLLAPLQVGLPVVVREGQTMRSRRGAALLQEMGHPELITNSEAAYIQLALDLAHDGVRRESLKQQLPHKFGQTPPFLDSRVYAANMEKLLERLFLASRS